MESLVGTAPGAVAVIIVVILFLKHLALRDQLLRQLHEEHLTSRKASQCAIEENTKVLGQHLELSRELAQVLKEVADNIKGCQSMQQEWRKSFTGGPHSRP